MTTDPNQSLRERLAERLNALMFRYKHLDTQAKLAAASGVAQTTVGRILRCDTSATLDNIEAIANAFGIDVTELFARPEQSNSLSLALDQAVRLPEPERLRISSFIDYTLREYAMNNPARLTFQAHQSAKPELEAAAARAASRPIEGKSRNAGKERPAKKRRRAA